jgi:hypothetical protein
LVALVLVLAGRSLAAGPRHELAARTRAKGPLASVAPFSVGRSPADEELAYFAPELSRALAAALESAGVDVGAGGEWPVAGKIEGLDGERVRLTATTRGHTVAVEGPLESLDQLAAQLAAKIVPLLSDGDNGKRVVGVKVAPLATRPESAVANVNKSEPPRKEPMAASPAPAAVPQVVAAAPPPSPPPQEAARPPDKPPEKKAEMPDVLPAYPGHGATSGGNNPGGNPYQSQGPPWGGFVTGRVVAHSIPDPPASYVGTGVSATQAFYGFLGRRLRLAVVPTGVGISSPGVAQDEGWRAAARSVVMARIENLEYLPQPAGVSVRLRLQVVVVREGRTLFRRVVDSPMSDPMRRTDPVYQAVSGALESIIQDLASVLGG